MPALSRVLVAGLMVQPWLSLASSFRNILSVFCTLLYSSFFLKSTQRSSDTSRQWRGQESPQAYFDRSSIVVIALVSCPESQALLPTMQVLAAYCLSSLRKRARILRLEMMKSSQCWLILSANQPWLIDLNLYTTGLRNIRRIQWRECGGRGVGGSIGGDDICWMDQEDSVLESFDDGRQRGALQPLLPAPPRPLPLPPLPARLARLLPKVLLVDQVDAGQSSAALPKLSPLPLENTLEGVLAAGGRLRVLVVGLLGVRVGGGELPVVRVDGVFLHLGSDGDDGVGGRVREAGSGEFLGESRGRVHLVEEEHEGEEGQDAADGVCLMTNIIHGLSKQLQNRVSNHPRIYRLPPEIILPRTPTRPKPTKAVQQRLVLGETNHGQHDSIYNNQRRTREQANDQSKPMGARPALHPPLLHLPPPPPAPPPLHLPPLPAPSALLPLPPRAGRGRGGGAGAGRGGGEHKDTGLLPE